ncbi:type IV conjugative transfer system lipoprotein TraV [Salmonella enterica]
MNRLILLQPVCGALLLSACAGTNSDFECTATTSDTCMTMEQANEKAKRLEQTETVKPVAASLPRLADGNFRTVSAPPGGPVAPVVVKPVMRPPSQKLPAPRPLFTADREAEAGAVVPVSTASSVISPRPLRIGEQTAALWIAPYIDSQDVYHQPSAVFFVIKPSAWGKPRVN